MNSDLDFFGQVIQLIVPIGNCRIKFATVIDANNELPFSSYGKIKIIRRSYFYFQTRKKELY